MPSVKIQSLENLLKALDDFHALDILVLDVAHQSTITDYMVICTGRSSRHVKAIAEQVVKHMKSLGNPPLNYNGLESGEWVIIDFDNYILHIMQPDIRALYNLEELWQPNP